MILKITQEDPYPNSSVTHYYYLDQLWTKTRDLYSKKLINGSLDGKSIEQMFTEMEEWAVEYNEGRSKGIVRINLDGLDLPELLEFYKNNFNVNPDQQAGQVHSLMRCFFKKKLLSKIEEIDMTKCFSWLQRDLQNYNNTETKILALISIKQILADK